MTDDLCYRFGVFRLQPARRALHEGDRALKLGSRALDLLQVLIERRDRVVGKDEMLDLVWPGLVVEENNLQVHVAALRKLLGHPAIATVPGRGYRFTMPVQVESGETGPAPAPPGPRPGGGAGELFGRQQELANLMETLAAPPGAGRARLVTVSGAGGIGKSRLARAVADGLVAGGTRVHWIDLAALSDGAQLARTVGRGIGLSVDGAMEPAQAIADALCDAGPVLVLDGAEHLLDAAANLIDALLARAAGLRVLATSQEPLRVDGEHVMRLAPLPCPEADGLAEASTCGAVQLFVARARAADPQFRLSEGNVAAVADICRRLDGIALAIVLAAGRVGLLGVDGVRTRLNDRFQVLTAGARVALRRHQTLRAALDWTFGLLNPAEQAVFRRLGCFVGGFSLDAAQSVCADDATDHWDVLEHLGSLVDKSLVLAEGEGLPRYRMLDTTRLFALEQLAQAGETEAVLARHAETVAELLGARSQWAVRWTASAAQFRGDAEEIDNARAALDWVSARHDPALAVSVAAHTVIAFVRADMVNDYLQRALPLRARLGTETPLALRALFWLSLARCGTKGCTAETLEAARHAVELGRRIGDAQLSYESLACAILIGANRADAPALAPWVEELRAIEDPQWPPAALSFGRWALYRAMRAEGRDEEALRLAEEQVQFSALRDPVFTLRIEGVNVVDCELALGRLDAAERRARQAIGRLRAAQVPESLLGPVDEHLAAVLVLQGRFGDAVPLARSAQRRLAADGDDLRLLEPLAWMLSCQDRPDDAAALHGHVEAWHRRLGLRRWPSAHLRWRALGDRLAAALGPERLAAQGRLGAAMRREAAYALALGSGGAGA